MKIWINTKIIGNIFVSHAIHNMYQIKKSYRLGKDIFKLHHHDHQIDLASVLSDRIEGISDEVKMGDGRLVLCLYNSQRLLICNTNSSAVDSIPLQDIPWDVTAVNNSTVAVTMPMSNCIEMYDINNKHKPKSIPLTGGCLVITTINNKLVVGCIGGTLLMIDDQTGKVVQTIHTDCRPCRLHTSGDRIIYSDNNINNNNLHCYSYTDNKVTTLKLQSCPYSITSVLDGGLYVVELSQNSMINSDPYKTVPMKQYTQCTRIVFLSAVATKKEKISNIKANEVLVNGNFKPCERRLIQMFDMIGCLILPFPFDQIVLAFSENVKRPLYKSTVSGSAIDNYIVCVNATKVSHKAIDSRLVTLSVSKMLYNSTSYDNSVIIEEFLLHYIKHVYLSQIERVSTEELSLKKGIQISTVHRYLSRKNLKHWKYKTFDHLHISCSMDIVVAPISTRGSCYNQFMLSDVSLGLHARGKRNRHERTEYLPETYIPGWLTKSRKRQPLILSDARNSEKTGKENYQDIKNILECPQSERFFLGGSYRSGFICCRRFLISTLAILILITAASCKEMSVTWTMRTNPVIFGKPANLTCYVTGTIETCQIKFLQWNGGNENKLLCRSGSCRNEKKYIEFQESQCSFILGIYNFSEDDVDVEYTCLYESVYHRQLLPLDSQQFQYIPGKQDITMANNSDPTERHVSLMLYIAKIYPSPVCTTTFQKENISRFVDVVPKRDGIFYRMTFNISFYPKEFHGSLQVRCEIGNTTVILLNETIPVWEERDFPNSDAAPGPKSIVIGMALGIFLCAVLVLFLVFIKEKKMGLKKLKLKSKAEKKEMIFTEKKKEKKKSKSEKRETKTKLIMIEDTNV